MKRTNKEIEQEVIDLYLNGESCRVIGDKLNMNQVTVFNILKRNNIQTRTNGGIYKIPESIIDDYNNGIKVTEIARKYNVHIKTIYNYLEAYGIPREYIYHNISLRRDYFRVIDSYDKAYFLGFIITDGNVSGNLVRLCLQKSDYYILEIFNRKISNENPLYYHPFRNEVTSHFKSKEVCMDLAKYGVIPNKTYSTFIPTYNMNMQLFSHLMRGLFDGNGWVSVDKNNHISVGFCAGNELVVTQFRDMLYYILGVSPIKVGHYKENVYSCNWSGKNDVFKICCYLYANCYDCFLVRKFKKFYDYFFLREYRAN